jgi:ribA/ribD-fused uncharacterized protein
MSKFIRSNHIFFWGGVFSNFHPICGKENLTSEHFYMEAKASFFGDVETLVRIREAKTPREAKRFGRLVEGFNQEAWDRVKEDFMFGALSIKATLDKSFKQALIDSGDKILVEASPTDRIWGIGFKEDDPNIENVDLWGQNLLGVCLMQVREELLEN